MAGNGRLGGQERIQLIAIDYHAATGTARTEYGGLKVEDGQTARVQNGPWQPYGRHKREGLRSKQEMDKKKQCRFWRTKSTEYKT